MDQLLIPNLMFEEELSGSATIGATASNRVAELIPATAYLQPGPNRCVLIGDDQRPTELPECLQAVTFVTTAEALERASRKTLVDAWGWSRQANDLARSLGSQPKPPSLETIIAVNQRQFLIPMDIAVPLDAELSNTGFSNTELSNTQLSRTEGRRADAIDANGHPWRQGLQFSRLCWTLESTEAALVDVCREHGPHWLLKSDISQAARNRIKGEGPHLNAEQVAWLSKRFAFGESICVEPWVERILDVGIQYEVHRTAIDNKHNNTNAARCLGVTQLLTNRQGQYSGTRLQTPEPPVPSLAAFDAAGLVPEQLNWLIDWGCLILNRAANRGYFGPAGIDAMVFRDQRGKTWLRPANDLNARYTMGRLAMEISGILASPGEAIWMFVPGKLLFENGKNLADLLPKSVRMERTSAGRIGQRPVSMASLLISSDDIEALSWAFGKLQSLFVSSASSS